jgi:hypothetical protein
MAWIIDDEGEVLDFFSSRLRNKLRVKTLLEQDHVPLLRNLGFIALREMPHGTSVSFRPATVSPIAFASLCYWLSDRVPSRLLLVVLEPGHSLELYSCLHEGLTRIEELMEAYRHDRLFQRCAVLPNAIAAPLAQVLAAWRVSGAASDFGSLRDVLEREPAGQYLLVQPDQEAGRLIIERTGAGLRIPDPAWARVQIGRPIADMPDTAYGQWVSEDYKSALQTGEPRLDHVEAKIYWPRLGRLQHRYDRLILPVQDRGRGVLLSVNNSAGGVRGDIKAA